MTVARSQPFVPLDEFLEMEPEPGMRLEWSAGFVHAMSGGSPQHAKLSLSIGALSEVVRAGERIRLHGVEIAVDDIYR